MRPVALARHIETEVVMFCPTCGAEAGASRFCRSCGTNLTIVSDLLDEGAASALRTSPLEGRTTLNFFHSSYVSNERDLNGHTAVAVFGATQIDLAAGLLAPGETKINVVSILGGTDILVPDDIAVRVTGISMFGGVNVRGREISSGIFSVNQYESPGYAAAVRRVHIDATSIFGGVKIRTP
jgi:Cell wall-active antibiotics response 4TMS YvqF